MALVVVEAVDIGAHIAAAIGPGFINSSSQVRDAAGNVYVAVTKDGHGSGDTDVYVLRIAAGTGAVQLIYVFRQSVYGKPGYASISIVSNAHLTVLIPIRVDAVTSDTHLRVFNLFNAVY